MPSILFGARVRVTSRCSCGEAYPDVSVEEGFDVPLLDVEGASLRQTLRLKVFRSEDVPWRCGPCTERRKAELKAAAVRAAEATGNDRTMQSLT